MTSIEDQKTLRALEPWGFSVHFQQVFSAWCEANEVSSCVVGRVITWEHGVAEVVVVGTDEVAPTGNADDGVASRFCEASGNLRRRLQAEGSDGDLATGDWVVVEAPTVGTSSGAGFRIIDVLTRRSQLRRRMAGSAVRAQTVAVNVDKVFVVTSANNDFNARRLERYLVAVWDSGAVPVVVLNKVDLCDDAEGLLREITPLRLAPKSLRSAHNPVTGWRNFRPRLVAVRPSRWLVRQVSASRRCSIAWSVVKSR